jgi:hypothetical protein
MISRMFLFLGTIAYGPTPTVYRMGWKKMIRAKVWALPLAETP